MSDRQETLFSPPIKTKRYEVEIEYGEAWNAYSKSYFQAVDDKDAEQGVEYAKVEWRRNNPDKKATCRLYEVTDTGFRKVSTTPVP